MIQEVWRSRHACIAGPHRFSSDDPPPNPADQRRHIEPWLAALSQAEHLNLLVGSGLTLAIAAMVGAAPASMDAVSLSSWPADGIRKAARRSAKSCGRGRPNIEDQIRAVLDLIAGLRVVALQKEALVCGSSARKAQAILKDWQTNLDTIMNGFRERLLATEGGIREALESGTPQGVRALKVLGCFLMAFASRAATRERLHIFTTNYDRLIEYGCDLLGLRVLDRFSGQLTPVFRSSRLGVDLHYNPPGIRGEPRYLEGVVRLTKLHGSIDWWQGQGALGQSVILRRAMPFGASGESPEPLKDSLIIYPNPAKDVETLEYPYAELFRDFAAATCQPNSVVVTYGYGFGDSHVNRMLRDTLTIPSTHLAVISRDDAEGRIERFCEIVGRYDQVTLLRGSHFGDIESLVDNYLPKPAIDDTTWRMVQLVNRRIRLDDKPEGTADSNAEAALSGEEAAR